MQKYTFFDTETGGLSPVTSGLCSLAMIAPNGAEFYALIKPVDGRLYEDQATKVHGLTREHLEKHGKPEAQALKELAAFFRKNCEGSFIVGANIAFDVAHLNSAIERNRGALGTDADAVSHRRVAELQTVALMAHEAGAINLPPDKKGMPTISLDAISAACGAGRKGKEHDSLEDVRLTRAAFFALRQSLTGLAGVASESLAVTANLGVTPEDPAPQKAEEPRPLSVARRADVGGNATGRKSAVTCLH